MEEKKAISKINLVCLIKDSLVSNDWFKVENADVSEITDMSSLFRKSKNIKNLDLSSWDTSNVTNMKKMFEGSNFNNPLFFDTSKVANMSGMFDTSEYNYPLTSFDTSRVKHMTWMFYNSKYNHPLDNFDTSNVIDMEGMFYNSDYNHPLNNFDTSNVTDLRDMFGNSKYNHPLDHFNLLNVHSIDSMFSDASYTYPFPQIDQLKNNNNCYHIDMKELREMNKRNVLLQKFLHNESDTNINDLISLFSDNNAVLTLIKNHSIITTYPNNTKPPTGSSSMRI